MTYKHIKPEQARILIVDDEADIRKKMRSVLAEQGYVIDDAKDAQAALRSMDEHIPDMILLDVYMPVTNGYEFCSEIRRRYADHIISIIMVTSLDDPHSIEKAFSLGATAFINKPINWDIFSYQIQYLLNARAAIAALKQSEQHLEYMDRVSQVLTRSSKTDSVLKDALNEILNIFEADRAFILHSIETENTETICEVMANQHTFINQHNDITNSEIFNNTLHRAKISEFPVVSEFGNKSHPEQADSELKTIQMIKAVHVDDNEAWYIIIQQFNQENTWSKRDQENFLRIGLRLGAVLSRHLLMEKLHENEKLLRQAQHIGHLGNWNWNVRTGSLTWSDEIYYIYGRRPDQYKPSYAEFFKVFFEEDHARLKQFEQSILNPGKTHSFEHRISLPNGDIRWVHEQSVGTFDEYGNLIEVNGTIQDITERIKKQEQEIHNQKMDAIGQLTSGVAHDFGNLMTIAQCNLEILHEKFSKKANISKDTKEIIEDIRSAVKDGVELTKQLLTFSHKKSIAPENISVAKRIWNFRKLIKNTLGDQISLSIKIQKDLPYILVDSAQFESSLLNLVINARDAMHSGGQLTIQAVVQTASSTSHGGNIDIPDVQQYVCISIMDTGDGMSNDVVKRAIEPFFTTKKSEGTGLGLSMVYGFIKQSRGEMIIDSRPGKGTTIKLLFPVYHEQQSVPVFEHSHQVQPFADETILVVEDNPAVRRFAVRCLGELGLNVLEAEDALSARHQLENNNIDLLFTDILMPGDISGRELAAWAAENNPELKILLTTAAEKEIIEGNRVTTQNYPLLLKPYDSENLIESIRNIL